MTGTIALMWNGMERFHEEKVARIMDFYEEEVVRIMSESQAARRQDTAEAQAARLQGEAKLEAVRRQDMAEVQAARLQGEAKLEAARLQDKVESYEFYAKALGTQDFEPSKEAVFRRQKEKEGGRQATPTGESAGTEREEEAWTGGKGGTSPFGPSSKIDMCTDLRD
eukprot:evm.model.NODE_20007_length_15494_cov_46.429070.1